MDVVTFYELYKYMAYKMSGIMISPVRDMM